MELALTSRKEIIARLLIVVAVLSLAPGTIAQHPVSMPHGGFGAARETATRPRNTTQARKFLIAKFGIPPNAKISSFDVWPSMDPHSNLPGAAFIAWTIRQNGTTHFYSAGYDFDRNRVTGRQHREYTH